MLIITLYVSNTKKQIVDLPNRAPAAALSPSKVLGINYSEINRQ